MNAFKEGRNCRECRKLALPALRVLEDKERIRQEMQNEIDKVRTENNELKRKIKDMTG